MAEQKQTNNSYTPLLVFFLVVLAFAFGMLTQKVQYLQGNGSNQPVLGTSDTTQTGNAIPTPLPAKVDVKPGTLALLGESNAKVTIVEFSDFQCPFCRRFFIDTFPQIKSEYIDSGKVKLSYRHFPLSFHPAAQKSAEAAECANDQGKFWEFHDLIYEKQEAQGQGTIQYTTDDIKTWASELGIDTAVFNDCLDSGKYASKVSEDANAGAKAGVDGTPGFFVNGKRIIGAQPFSVFKAAIDEELSK